MKKISIPFICFLFLLACTSSAVLTDEDLSAAEYFQKAYEASDNKNYKLAIRYYEAFQREYPEALERNLWAEYEIAFTYHKMGDREMARELFSRLIARYENEDSENYPPAPRALAEKVLAGIED